MNIHLGGFMRLYIRNISIVKNLIFITLNIYAK